MKNFRVFFAVNRAAIIFVCKVCMILELFYVCINQGGQRANNYDGRFRPRKLNPRSCKYTHTLETIWKIKDFPHPVASTANTFFCLMNWSKASSWTGFNSTILEKNHYPTQIVLHHERLARIRYHRPSLFLRDKKPVFRAPGEHSGDSANESSC